MPNISKINLPNDDNNPYNIDAVTVNGHTVDKDVPSNAKFTDTVFHFSILKTGGHSTSSTSSAPLRVDRGIGLQVELDPDGITPTDISLFTTSDAYSYEDKLSNTTGYMLITIKPETSWMLSFTLNSYGSYNAYSIAISGYNYGTNHWHAPNAQLLYSSDGATSKTVYFGYTGDWKLWVAVPASSYQGLSITNITNGFTKITDRAADIFNISRVSSFPGTTQKTVNAVNNSIINLIYPVGAIYMSVNNTNPGTWLIGTTWVAWGKGRVPIGIGSNGTTNYTTVEATGGAERVLLDAEQVPLPVHTHTLSTLNLNVSKVSGTQYGFAPGDTFKGDVVVAQNTGTYKSTALKSSTISKTSKAPGSYVSLMQPYITCYMWKRTA